MSPDAGLAIAGTHTSESTREAADWRATLRDTALVGATALVTHGLGIGTSLWLRRLLDPAAMGVWQGVKLPLGYANYLNLGVSKGATRELSVAMGRGDASLATRGLNLAFTINTVTSLLFAVMLAVASLCVAWRSGGFVASPWVLGLLVIGALAVLQRHVTFQITVLRAEQAFALTSRLAVVEGALTLLFAGAATWLWGLPGLYAGTLAVPVLSMLYLRWNGARRHDWTWDATETRRLVAIGAPIVLAGVASTLFRSLDRWLILAHFPDGEFQLGCYSLALLVSGQLFGLANMLAMVMAPRYARLFGRTRSRAAVARLAVEASQLQALVMGLAGGVSMVVAGPVLGGMLPAYHAGLAALAWSVPGALALGLALPPTHYLVAVDRQRSLLVVSIVGALLVLGFNLAALWLGGSLAHVAAATSAAYVGYWLLLAGVSVWPQLDRTARIRYVLSHAVTCGPPLVLAALLQKWWPSTLRDLGPAVGQTALVALAWLPGAAVVWMLGRWNTVWRGSLA